jgi:uncharacterized protein (TIGR02594 family)
MKEYLIFTAAMFLSACDTIANPFIDYKKIENNSVVTAQPYIGLDERIHRTELKALLDVDPIRTEWCAAFVNAVLDLDGIPGSDSVSDVPLMARSFLSWGERVDPTDIQRGDVVVFPRGNQGWQGHVGFYVDTQFIDGKEIWIVLGGNQSNEVRYDLFSPSTSLGIRRYSTELINTNVK